MAAIREDLFPFFSKLFFCVIFPSIIQTNVIFAFFSILPFIKVY
jgi:hypothetical protein